MSTPKICEIRMQHPARNALGEELLGWLERRLDAAAGSPVLLSGTPAAFCAGLDLKYVAGLEREGMEAYLRRVDRLVARLFQHPAPTVALIEGHAIAGGCVLACACDHRVVADDESIRIGFKEVALGACFPPAILRLLRLRLPARGLERALLGADLYPPAGALELGLVDEVATNAPRAARDRVEHLASHPAASYALTKRALRAGTLELSAEDERRFSEELSQWTSPELRQRVLAALGG